MTVYLQLRCLNGTYGYDGYVSTYMLITMVPIYLLMCLLYQVHRVNMIITENASQGVQSVRRFNYGAFSFYLLHFNQSYILINHILCVRYSTAYSICWLIASYLRVEYSTQLFLKAFTVSIVLVYILVLVVFCNCCLIYKQASFSG